MEKGARSPYNENGESVVKLDQSVIPESERGLTHTEAKQAIQRALEDTETKKEFGTTAHKPNAALVQEVDLLGLDDEQQPVEVPEVNVPKPEYHLDISEPNSNLQPVLGPSDLGSFNVQKESSQFANIGETGNNMMQDELEPVLGPRNGVIKENQVSGFAN